MTTTAQVTTVDQMNRARIAHTEFRYTINFTWRPAQVTVRIMHVNPDATATIQDGSGHVWYGVPGRHLLPAS